MRSQADRRKARWAERVEIGGRLVHPRAPHGNGTTNGYSNYGCRCEPCSVAWAKYCTELRKFRASRGAMVDGCWYVPNAPHGTAGGYNNYGCGCERCTAAWAKASRRRAKATA
ncbi:Uncharacterised protein [Mycobacteroides abscessus subsp. abscessus]|nr:Uncharacterised protein [Mycobacteroides abscessus subsp. abscessus]